MNDTLFLRFIAILLITNSHLDALYPNPAFASGGSLGNSLFFMLSGLGLALSAKSKPLQGFWAWLFNRLSRIYPPLWLVVLIIPLLLQGHWQVWRFQDYLFHFLYPTHYWFISALLVFYFLIYPLLETSRRSWLPWLIGGLLIPYFLFYCTVMDLSHFSIENASLFKWIFYLQVTLFGIWLAPLYQQWKATSSLVKNDLIGLALIGLCYLLLKLANATGYLLPFQFLVQWITFPFVFFMLRLACQPMVDMIFNTTILGKLVLVLGTCTLEIYLLQHHIYTMPLILSLMFPLNIVVFWLLVVPAAMGIHQLAGLLNRRPGARA